MRSNIRNIVRTLQNERSKSGRQGRETKNISARLPTDGETIVGSGLSNPPQKLTGPTIRSRSTSSVTPQSISSGNNVNTEKILIEARLRDRKIEALEKELQRLKTQTKVDHLVKDISLVKTKLSTMEKQTLSNIKVPPDVSKEVKDLQAKIASLEKQTNQIKNGPKDKVKLPPDVSKEVKDLQVKLAALEKQTNEIKNAPKEKVKLPPDVSKEVKDLQAKIAALEKQTNQIKNGPKDKLKPPPDVSKEVKDLQVKLAALEKQTNEIKNVPKEKVKPTPDVSKEVKDLQAKLAALEKQTNDIKNAPKEKVKLPPDVSKEVKDLQAKIAALEKQTNEMKNVPKEKVKPTPDVSKEVKDLQAKIAALEKQTNEMKNAPKEKVELPPDVSKEVKDLQAKLSALEKQTNEMKNAPKEKLELPPDVSKEVKEIQDKLSNVDTINNRINDMNDTIQNLEGLVISNDKKIEDELQRARISLRNEQAENERLFKKNIQDTLNHRSQSVPRLRRGNSSLNTSPTPIPRRSEIDNDRMDTHRVMELPMFSAELFDNKVIKGGSPNLLLDGDEWNITCDNKNGFDEGRYICPNAGAYDVRLLCKTLSTSVTARITLYHMNDSGNILRAYAMDQSNIVNEHCAVVRIAHAEEGDSFTLWVENRFNIALKGVEKVVDDSNKEGYDLVSTMCQIVYNPARGYCET